ncbi:MAG: deferrochelatase/peroxidase EfeB [Solirubrobacterales bacterium]|nr:deferrochelatase/peroxidase EfeB [Solirubrobacterales bacterium]
MSPLDRRQFLGRSAAVVGAGAIGLGVGAEVASGSSTSEPSAEEAANRVLTDELAARSGFDGYHQAGILTPRQQNAAFIALDAIAPRQNELIEALKELSYRAASLTQGGGVAEIEIDDPPPDSGLLGDYNAPDGLTVTIAFGSTLFDHRYGLANAKPPQLVPMPAFEKDGLEPDRCHGDVLLSICADHRDTVVHTMRELMRTTAGVLTPRWRIDGFQSTKRGPTPRSSTRNLFGFRDGTANPDPTDAKLMDELVWVKPGAGEPAWTHGGTYQVVRTIRMQVEFWDRVGMFEQTNMIGRDRVTGAPLGGTHEFESLRYDLDPHGKRIPLSAHIRLANPRTPATQNQRILRRPYNYDRGLDEAGNLDQGLLFVAFNQDINRQFETVQKRLEEEEMADYITPVGGGYYFTPRAAQSSGDWVGSGMFTA